MDDIVHSRRFRGFTFGYALIALAFDVLVTSALGEAWYFVPILLILLGVYGLAITRILWSDHSGRRHSSSNGTYVFFWSSLLTLVGIIVLVNDAFPDNIPLLGTMLVIWIGVSIAVISAKGTKVRRG
jgi:heme/copper-type cytochrome/quinol oxidase subunit 4